MFSRGMFVLKLAISRYLRMMSEQEAFLRVEKKIKAHLKRTVNGIFLLSNYFYDAARFFKSSSAVRSLKEKTRLSGHLAMDSHRIEKGLALPAPRPGFGMDVVDRLLENLAYYEKNYGHDDLTAAVDTVLRAYQAFQEKYEVDHAALSCFLAGRRKADCANVDAAGTLAMDKDVLFPFETSYARDFLRSRRSLRQFTGEIVKPRFIEEAIALAQRAPSVCNRQSARVFVSNERHTMDRILSFQNGNRGFGHLLGALFIVTSDMRLFTNVGERNQCFVDGGIFAMALLQALHCLKLGACMLNWSVHASQDRALRSSFGIPDSHAVVAMIGCGCVGNSLCVAASPRKATDEITCWLHDPVVG